jgi:signal transduction histidine kinase
MARGLFGSVISKLLAVFLVAGLGIQLAVGGFGWYLRKRAGEEFHRTVAHYLELVASEIGAPPDLERAAALAAAGAFQLRVVTPEASWSTRPEVPENLPPRMRLWSSGPEVRAGFFRGRVLAELREPGARFIFELGPAPPALAAGEPLALLLAVLAGILAAAFVGLRHILKPIARLREGVREVAAGNLDHRIPLPAAGGPGRPRPGAHRRPDEFDELAQAFNDMTRRIRDMIQARERLMLDVSHELRSPLTRLKVALEFLPEDPARESIRADVGDMEAMITAILESARIRHRPEELAREPVDLAAAVRAAAAELEGRPPGIRMEALPETLVGRVHRELFRTVVRNLLANALNYSRPGSPAVEVRLERRPPAAVLEVRDHGIGIAPEDLPRIFEPFFRADPSRARASGGYGLGLSLCRTIVEAHGGVIEAESPAGGGALFRVRLPLASPPPPPGEKAGSGAGGRPGVDLARGSTIITK